MRIQRLDAANAKLRLDETREGREVHPRLGHVAVLIVRRNDRSAKRISRDSNAISRIHRKTRLRRLRSAKSSVRCKQQCAGSELPPRNPHPWLGAADVCRPALNCWTIYSDVRSENASTEIVVVLSVQLRKTLASAQ